MLKEGKVADAIAAFGRAVQLNPQDASNHCELGFAQLRAGAPSHAIQSFERSLALRPNDARGQYGLGIALQQQGHDKPAIAAYRRAVELAPKQADAHARLGDLLYALGSGREALTCFQRAASAAGNSTVGRLNRVKALLLEGKTTEAEGWLRRTIALDPKNSEANRHLANLLAEDGRLDEASARFEEAIALDPRQVTPFHGLVHTRKLTEADRPLIERMRTRLDCGPLTATQRMRLHFALGKALDDLGEYADAMRHFDAANAIRGQRYALDRAGLARRVDRLINSFTPDFFVKHAHLGTSSEAPLLILGMPRSGTTLVEQVVSAHPSVAAGGELGFWNNRDATPEDLLLDESSVEQMRRSAEDYTALLRKVAGGAARVTDKTPYYFFWIGHLRLAFPNAIIIHCRRNPIDTCLSIYMTNFAVRVDFAGSCGDLAFYYQQYARLMDHWRQVLPSGVLYEVKYEDLVVNSEAEIRRLIAAANLVWDETCLRPESNPRVIRTASVWQARQPIYRTAVERWRRYEPWVGELRTLVP